MRRIVRVLGSVLLFAGAAAGAAAATYTVTAQGESGPGSIGAAIQSSNASVGVLDTIEFDLPGTPPFLVMLFMGIPTITDPVVIDATTQPGYAGTPLFQIRQGLGNGAGLTIAATAAGTTIRGLSFADLNEGIRIEGDGNTIQACFFGTDVTGTVDVGNGIGIHIAGGDQNQIGGTTDSASNLISGNNGYGIRIDGGDANQVRGNRIGTKLDGTEALGNQVGISIVTGSDNNTIGGTAAGAGNLISGNTWGIELAGSSGIVVAGNRIGTNAAGSTAIGNGNGIQANTVTNLTVGGTVAAARNIISGNGTGILVGSGDETSIFGNFIGTDAAGTAPLGNDYGITVNSSSATDTRIGGPTSEEENVIAYNGTGIWNLGLRTTIRRNSIHDNDALGIDHQNVGPSPNDAGDSDGVQNFPNVDSVIITATSVAAGGSVRIQGVLKTDPGDYTLDFYANPPCSENPQDFLEGETWLGSAPLTIAGGEAPFDVTLPVSVATGSRISATATDATGRTSEFSQRLPFSMTPTAGPGAGGTMVTVLGTNFEPGLTATLGGVPVTNMGVVFDSFFTANTPALPGGIWDLVITTPSGRSGTLPRAWTVDFADVPPSHPFYSFIQILVRHGITAGMGGGSYGSTLATLRQQMAVFLMKAIHGICYIPPPCTGIFDDVPCPSGFADWIEAFAAAGITGGCGGDLYCPTNPVRRDQMAVFLLKAKYGSGLRSARLYRRLRRRRLLLAFRPVDRAARRGADHRRLRRRELLPPQRDHARSDGGVYRQDVRTPVRRPCAPRTTSRIASTPRTGSWGGMWRRAAARAWPSSRMRGRCATPSSTTACGALPRPSGARESIPGTESPSFFRMDPRSLSSSGARSPRAPSRSLLTRS